MELRYFPVVFFIILETFSSCSVVFAVSYLMVLMLVNMLMVFLQIQMGIADAILDLVSSGTTLRENNLKEIEGGVVLESQVSKSFSVRGLPFAMNLVS